MTPHELHQLETQLVNKLRKVRQGLKGLKAAVRVGKTLCQLETQIVELEQEIEVGRYELPGVSAFKTPIRTASVRKQLTKARAAWRSAWQE
jgi:hypothetical protein